MAKFPSDPCPSTIRIVADFRSHARSKPSVPGDDVYIDAVYTGLIGTGAVATYRRFLRELAAASGCVELSVEELAKSLGVPRRKMAAILKRLVDFRIMRWTGTELVVPGDLPQLSDRVLPRLSESAVRHHFKSVQSLAIRP
jgi:hypothetical protein